MIEIRLAEPQDLDQVMAIELASFPIPKSRKMYEAELNYEASRFYVACDLNPPSPPLTRKGPLGTKGGKGGFIVGYIDFWVVLDEAHLITIAVDPRNRRQRIASKLFQFMFDYVKPLDIRSIYLEVRPSNKAAIYFYKSFGFEPIGVRKGYYPDKEDAVVMVKKI